MEAEGARVREEHRISQNRAFQPKFNTLIHIFELFCRRSVKKCAIGLSRYAHDKDSASRLRRGNDDKHRVGQHSIALGVRRNRRALLLFSA